MNQRFKRLILTNVINSIGWKSKRKIVVIESDDWGSIRMPSKEVYRYLTGQGITFDDNYNCFDSLESGTDLTGLFEILNSVRDINGNPAVVTANFVMTNPDFNKIREDQFEHYTYELFTSSYEKYGYGKSYSLVQEGYSNKIFHPQLHGRDHINVPLWMRSLRAGDPEVMLGFNSGFFGFHNENLNPGERHFMAALDYHSNDEAGSVNEALAEAALLFEQAFGYKSKSFIAPCYTWDKEAEKVLAENKIKYLQGNFFQLLPIIKGERRRKRIHYLGQKNKIGQTYLTRNVFFEPSESEGFDWINSALKDVEIAFKFRKPAIISSHRVNYIGSINDKNRDRNLRLLDNLLSGIMKKWPDVEFMTSDTLGDIINTD